MLHAPAPWPHGLMLSGVETPLNLACVCGRDSREATMDQESLRLFIRRKLGDGRLPHDGIKRVWSSPSDGETCDACDTVLSKDQLVMEGVTLDLGRRPLVSRSGITKGAPSSHRGWPVVAPPRRVSSTARSSATSARLTSGQDVV